MRKLALALLIVLLPSMTEAATRYVRTDGNNTNWNTGGCQTNTAGGACRNIDYVADRASPGDIVRVQAGTYSERVSPLQSGASGDGNTITFVADGTVTVCGWDWASNLYIRVIGFIFDSNAGTCSFANYTSILSGTNTGIEMWNNTFQDSEEHGIQMGPSDRAHSSVFIGNYFRNHGIGVYSGNAMTLRGNYNVVAYNHVTNIDPDGFIVDGTHNRYLNNYMHDMIEQGAGHPDMFQSGPSQLGTSYNLYEAQYYPGTGINGNEHVGQKSNLGPLPSNANCGTGVCGVMTEDLWRFNVFHNIANSITPSINQTCYANVSDTRYYNNSNIDGNMGGGTGSSYSTDVVWYSSGCSFYPGGFVKNNIHYNIATTYPPYNISVFNVEGPLVADYNLVYDPDVTYQLIAPWTSQAHAQSNINPNFINPTSDVFILAAGAGEGFAARGTAGPLTTTSGSGTGTTFYLATNTGGYFVPNDSTNQPKYNGALVPGDTITVGTGASADTVTIQSISGDTVTVTATFTWTDGEPVFFGTDTTPDMGALPYKTGSASDYTLTATYSGTSTITVTPNDATLVRWVVCYNDNVPYSVDSTAPYTCQAQSGAFTARVYPRHAVLPLWVDATSGAAPPAPNAPTNVRIR